jgi:hypothetical protein
MGLPSGGSSFCRPRREDPQQRERKLYYSSKSRFELLDRTIDVNHVLSFGIGW